MFDFFKNLIKARQEWLSTPNNLPPTYKYLRTVSPNPPLKK